MTVERLGTAAALGALVLGGLTLHYGLGVTVATGDFGDALGPVVAVLAVIVAGIGLHEARLQERELREGTRIVASRRSAVETSATIAAKLAHLQLVRLAIDSTEFATLLDRASANDVAKNNTPYDSDDGSATRLHKIRGLVESSLTTLQKQIPALVAINEKAAAGDGASVDRLAVTEPRPAKRWADKQRPFYISAIVGLLVWALLTVRAQKEEIDWVDLGNAFAPATGFFTVLAVLFSARSLQLQRCEIQSAQFEGAGEVEELSTRNCVALISTWNEAERLCHAARTLAEKRTRMFIELERGRGTGVSPFLDKLGGELIEFSNELHRVSREIHKHRADAVNAASASSVRP